MEEKRGINPLTPLAFIALLLITLDIYTAVSSHDLRWRVAVGWAELTTFLVLYFRKSPRAWIVIPIIGATQIFSALLHYPSDPPPVRLFALCLGVLVGLFVLGYGSVLRKRYRFYLETRREYHNADGPTI